MSTEDSRSRLYRVYEGGILVYDSKSRLPYSNDTGLKLSKNVVSPDVLKDIEKYEPYDRFQFINMYVYPSFKYYQHEYTLVAPSENTLVFDSKFESGNLSKAVKISENEYNLYLDYDVETKGYTQ